jgi:molybdopterin converting factor small subunit
MIRVACLGHIRTSLGAAEIQLDADDLDASEIVERLRRMSHEENPGFDCYNTLAMVDDGEAYVPASSSRRIRKGERVVLIPFSHGG